MNEQEEKRLSEESLDGIERYLREGTLQDIASRGLALMAILQLRADLRAAQYELEQRNKRNDLQRSLTAAARVEVKYWVDKYSNLYAAHHTVEEDSVRMIYLASPYKHESHEVEIFRYRAASLVAAKLLNEGRKIFCPIAYSHPLVESFEANESWEKVWRTFDFNMLKNCNEMWILELDGWKDSWGIAEEVTIAKAIRIPIFLYSIDGKRHAYE